MAPNVLITGTPGVGKSSLCEELVKRLGEGYRWHNVSKIAKDNKFVGEYDEELDCPELDEDKLLDFMEPAMANGGNIVEYHGCEFFPERWFHLVFVIQCDNTVLFDRLKKRNYKEKKIRENIECEIFQTILEEAQGSYDEAIVHTLKNENEEDREAALEKMRELIEKEERNPKKRAKVAESSDDEDDDDNDENEGEEDDESD